MPGNKNSGRKAVTEYAIYEADELLGVGTAKELSNELGITEQYVRALVCRPNKLRYAIRLED